VNEKRDDYLFGQAKTRGLKEVTAKKKEEREGKNIGVQMRLFVLLIEPYPQLLEHTAFKSRLN